MSVTDQAEGKTVDQVEAAFAEHHAVSAAAAAAASAAASAASAAAAVVVRSESVAATAPKRMVATGPQPVVPQPGAALPLVARPLGIHNGRPSVPIDAILSDRRMPWKFNVDIGTSCFGYEKKGGGGMTG